MQSKQTASGSGRGSGGRGSGDAGAGELASLQGIEFVLYLHVYFEAELATFHSGNLLGCYYLYISVCNVYFLGKYLLHVCTLSNRFRE